MIQGKYQNRRVNHQSSFQDFRKHTPDIDVMEAILLLLLLPPPPPLLDSSIRLVGSGGCDKPINCSFQP